MTFPLSPSNAWTKSKRQRGRQSEREKGRPGGQIGEVDMILGKNGKLLVENRGPGVRVLRFIHPDLRDQIYDRGDIEQCRLFKDIKSSALSYISEGEALIMNLGLIEHFPSMLYGILLKARETIRNHGGCVILCSA